MNSTIWIFLELWQFEEVENLQIYKFERSKIEGVKNLMIPQLIKPFGYDKSSK